MTQIDLKNENILVTGASTGIGKEVARYLMKMGARVAVHYHSNKKSAEELVSEYKQTGSEIFKADLELESEAIGLFQNVIESFGTINTIILNAAVSLEHSTNEPVDDWLRTWKKTLDINLKSADKYLF